MGRAIEWHDTLQYGRLAGLVGDEVLFKQVKAGALWEPDLVGIFERHIKPGTVAVDVGANIGVHSIAMMVRQPDVARVVAFEPHPEIFAALAANAAARPTIDARNIALSDRSGTMHMVSLEGSNSPAGAVLWKDRGPQSLPVSVRRLDDLGLRDISFMKIDVEGHEMEMISGAEATIRAQRPTIVMEIWDFETPAVRNSKIERICRLGYSASPATDIDVLFTPI